MVPTVLGWPEPPPSHGKNSRKMGIPQGITYPKKENHLQNAIFGGYVSFLEGISTSSFLAFKAMFR